VNPDPLADLGLDLETAPAVVAAPTKQPAVVAPVQAKTEGATTDREEVEVGEIEFGFVDYIPTAKRKAEGSKYKFDKLPAPTEVDGKPRIANFIVRLQPGVEADKLRRSVQSATTQANRQGAAEGKYFVSRSVTENGEFVGMMVLRTDKK
jgi:hypothetical protein